MNSTIENIQANIELQFQSIQGLIEVFDKYQFHSLDQANLSDIKDSFETITNTYYLTTGEALRDYFDSSNDTVRFKHHNQFVKTIKSCNLVGCLKRIYTQLSKIRKTHNFDEPDIIKYTKQFELVDIDESFENNKSDFCPKCQVVYDIEEKTAEFTCKLCGHIEKMYGVVFEDEQFFYQEGQRTKHGKYDPIKHAKFWLDRIQGKETTEIPESVINAVKRCIRRDQLWIHDVTCEVVRSYLKQTKNTNYNNHVVLIRKIITGVEPEQLTDHEIRLIYMYFGISTQKFNQLKGDSRKNNCPYHPFFIYKIIEQVLRDAPYSSRRKNILSCIHLQSRDTLIENDKMWFDICEYIPEFTKIATDGGIRV